MKKSIRKILVANRGEIAIRIMRSCKEMGISSVAVYSDADASAPYLRHADETRYIGASPARESYLNGGRIIAAARESGADAIHPGYGFLSENAGFVDAVTGAGLTFIGPTAKEIRLLGDKTSAKAVATEAGVPVVPGTVKALEGPGEALEVAKGVGYPVLLKAAAGGGGKGMRVVREAAELPAALALAKSEAASSFSDDRVYVEKYIESPRHVEVQVMGDGHGGVIHLGERECSIQRRHQKIIEESPSPAIDEKTRAALTASAVKLASKVGYSNAGTVEFILDREGRFYFMEVNTRLQVEHPVTEARTGIDLVREQIRAAGGERLSVGQSDVRFSGHAIECRIYAEDSANSFLPFTGTIGHIVHPSRPGIRLDTGIEAGSAISAHYDPMISKVIASGKNRAEALAAMTAALGSYEIYGVKTNLDLLLWVLADPEFVAGKFDTHYLDRRYRPELFAETPEDLRLAAGLAAGYVELRSEARFRASAGAHDRRWAIHRFAGGK